MDRSSHYPYLYFNILVYLSPLQEFTLIKDDGRIFDTFCPYSLKIMRKVEPKSPWRLSLRFAMDARYLTDRWDSPTCKRSVTN